MKLSSTYIAPTLAVIAAMIFAVVLVLSLNRPLTANGSTARGSEYQGTTTTAGFAGGPATTKEIQLLSTGGTFGSVTVTGGPVAGSITFYDATTSNVNARAASMSTSSILLVDIPVGTASTTYTFDRIVVNGLWMSIVGSVPTSTITFRQ